MSHPLLDQLEHVLRLLAIVKDMPQDEYSPELEKYLRWAARKTAKAYWYSIELTNRVD